MRNMVEERTVDIHQYEKLYARAERLVREGAISDRNKELILGYRDICLLKGTCGRVRLIRVMGALTLFARMIQQDFDTMTKPDLERLIGMLLARRPAYTPETLGSYKAIIRRFMSWVLVPDEFPTKHPPAMLSWISCHVKAKDKRKLNRSELLTPAEIERLLSVAPNTRDRALIKLLWETGGRISEIGNLQLKHITKHQFGYTLDLKGKTGQRCPLIVSSAPYLTQWLSLHPFPSHPDNPLWVYNQQTTKPKPVRYQALRQRLITYLKRAKIEKHIYPHLFRHSRATYCVATGLMNEQQAKTYFGWSPSSNMLAIYAHLTSDDANHALLRENNLAPPTATQGTPAPRTCSRCTHLNPTSAPYCLNCNNVFDEQAVLQDRAATEMTNTLVLQLFEVLVKQGLLDQAADQVHQAGLGPALQALAAQHKPQR